MNTAPQSLRVLIGSTEHTLHVLDVQDVALSPVAANMVRRAARRVLARRMPALDVERLPMASVMGVFLDQIYWEEDTGRLLLCADLPELCCCLPIPRAHWRVNGQGEPAH